MIELLFALAIFGLAFIGLAVGVLRGGPGIAGSCGGLNRIPGIESDCGGRCLAAGKSCERRRRPRDARN